MKKFGKNLFTSLKNFLPDRPIPTTIRFGPFRGGKISLNPRNSMRKVLGLYEHELNVWIEGAICQVTRVIDVGGNDGYFTFGSAAAFERMGKRGEILTFEPQETCVCDLRQSVGFRFPDVQSLESVGYFR